MLPGGNQQARARREQEPYRCGFSGHKVGSTRSAALKPNRLLLEEEGSKRVLKAKLIITTNHDVDVINTTSRGRGRWPHGSSLLVLAQECVCIGLGSAQVHTLDFYIQGLRNWFQTSKDGRAGGQLGLIDYLQEGTCVLRTFSGRARPRTGT